jgi:hypothetical protein
MKHRLYSLFIFGVATSLILSACALSHRGRPFYINDPADRTRYRLDTPIYIGLLRGQDIPAEYTSFQYEVYDNGVLVNTHVENRATSQVRVTDPIPHSGGFHTLSARARAYNSAASFGDWYVAPSVCVYIGPVEPPSYDCLEYGFPAHLEIATQDPSVLTIEPTAPLMNEVVPNPGGNSTGNNNGNNPPAASGCTQYTDQSSCNLAGCSWSGSSCIVTP